MRGLDLAEAMASAVDRIVSGTGALDRAIEAIVGTIGLFSRKDATRILGGLSSRNGNEGYSEGQAAGRIPSSGDAGHPRGGAPGSS